MGRASSTTTGEAPCFGSTSAESASTVFSLATADTKCGLRLTSRRRLGCARTAEQSSAFENEFSLWDYNDDFRTLAVVEPDLPDNRLNEGRVGPDGAFWVGTMQNNLNPDGSPKEMSRNSGAIYRVDADGGVERLTPREFGITNTMAWTRHDLFLTADTLRNEIFAYDFRVGALANKRIFAAPIDRGAPDGSCLDADGRLWNCRVAGGACVACFKPDGRLDRLVELPCSWPTSCAFGGPDLSTLFVTSARFTMTEEHLANCPQEGGLFAVETSAQGQRENRFG